MRVDALHIALGDVLTANGAVIDADTDVRGLLLKAQQTGAVRHFTYTTPSLTDLFREAVK